MTDTIRRKTLPTRQLEIRHVEEALDREIVICADRVTRYAFVFHVLTKEYRVIRDGVTLTAGNAVEEILAEYNTMVSDPVRA